MALGKRVNLKFVFSRLYSLRCALSYIFTRSLINFSFFEENARSFVIDYRTATLPAKLFAAILIHSFFFNYARVQIIIIMENWKIINHLSS